MAKRLVPLEGTQNFRDLGGYPTEDGRRVRHGRIYRADALTTLSTRDLAHLDEIGLRLVVDFRGDEEVTLEPGPYRAHPEVAYLNVPIGENASPTEWRDRFERGDLGDLDEHWLPRSYAAMLDGRPEAFAEVMNTLGGESALPAVFHCTAGKDRTGVMAMLLLRLLGVPREHVIADYALTAEYTGGKIKAANRWFSDRGVDLEQAAHLFSARPANMEATLDHLETKHGGIERYAREALSLDATLIANLRDELTEA
jgi:protein-tyrosine phosphatase